MGCCCFFRILERERTFFQLLESTYLQIVLIVLSVIVQVIYAFDTSYDNFICLHKIRRKKISESLESLVELSLVGKWFIGKSSRVASCLCS